MKTHTGDYRYEFRVERHLGTAVTSYFPDFCVTLNADGTTTLSGPVVDQAALHGVLARIRDLGLSLIAVSRVMVPNEVQPAEEQLHV